MSPLRTGISIFVLQLEISGAKTLYRDYFTNINSALQISVLFNGPNNYRAGLDWRVDKRALLTNPIK